MNNEVFEKTIENMRKNRGIKLVTTEQRRIYLITEPKYHATKHFSENWLAIEMKNNNNNNNKKADTDTHK